VIESLVISGWSAVGPLGIGAAEYGSGVRAARSGLGPGAGLPNVKGGFVPGFELREVLGRKNTRSMDRATGLAVLTVGMLLAGKRPGEGDNVGLVLGTTTGSVQSMMDFTRDSLTRERPYLVDPARFPNTVMNCAAGQSAIWYGLRGPNATIAGGQGTGLAALSYASRLHRCGHSRTLICGAVEELSPQRAWLEARAREDNGSAVLGEGCAVFWLESRDDALKAGRVPLAELLSVKLRVAISSADTAVTLAGCIASALEESGEDAGNVWALAADLDSAELAEASRICQPRRHIALAPLLGDTGAASVALLLAAVLAHADGDPEAEGATAVVASCDRDGQVGCALVRLASRPGPEA
jgi:3-oxoacyl-[acyl-carrier-protein] synthase II